MKPKLIGISGYSQTGKDTVAHMLEEEGYHLITLADPIRAALYKLDPIVSVDNRGRLFGLQEVIDDIGWDDAKVHNPEIRRLMQVFGTDVGREMFGMEVWLDKARKKMNQNPAGKFVITDVRFPNELDAVRALGGWLLKVTRPGTGPINSHSSDKGLPSNLFDFVIANDGTLDKLHQRVQFLREVVG